MVEGGVGGADGVGFCGEGGADAEGELVGEVLLECLGVVVVVGGGERIEWSGRTG